MFISFSLSIFNCEMFLYIHSQPDNLPVMFEKLFIVASYFVGINIYPVWIISQHAYCHKLLNALNLHNIVIFQLTRLFQDENSDIICSTQLSSLDFCP